MRALLFAPAFAPNMGSESLTASKLVLALRAGGWEVDVISRSDIDLYGNEWAAPWLELRECSRQLVTQQPGRVRVLYERVIDALKLGHPIPGLRWASLALDTGRTLVAETAYDVILSRSPPEIAHLPALLLATETGIPWIANWNDPPIGAWPSPYERENGGPLRERLYRRFVRAAYNGASMNTFPSQELAAHVESHFAMNPNSVVIPHATLELASRGSCSGSTFVIRHAGKLRGARDPRPLLEGVKLFLDREMPKAGHFVLEQIGHADADFVSMCCEYGIDRFVRASGPQSYADTMQLLTSSHVNLLLEAPCAEGIFLPGKLTDYAAAGRPILAASPRRGVAERLLRQHGGGIHVDVSSPPEIAEAIGKLHGAWLAGTLESTYSSPTLAQEYLPQTIRQGYEAALQHVSSRNQRSSGGSARSPRRRAAN